MHSHSAIFSPCHVGVQLWGHGEVAAGGLSLRRWGRPKIRLRLSTNWKTPSCSAQELALQNSEPFGKPGDVKKAGGKSRKVCLKLVNQATSDVSFFFFFFFLSIPLCDCVMLECNIEVPIAARHLSRNRCLLYTSLQRNWGAVLRLCGETLSRGLQFSGGSNYPWSVKNVNFLYLSAAPKEVEDAIDLFCGTPVPLLGSCHLGFGCPAAEFWEDSLTCLLYFKGVNDGCLHIHGHRWGVFRFPLPFCQQVLPGLWAIALEEGGIIPIWLGAWSFITDPIFLLKV